MANRSRHSISSIESSDKKEPTHKCTASDLYELLVSPELRETAQQTAWSIIRKPGNLHTMSLIEGMFIVLVSKSTTDGLTSISGLLDVLCSRSVIGPWRYLWLLYGPCVYFCGWGSMIWKNVCGGSSYDTNMHLALAGKLVFRLTSPSSKAILTVGSLLTYCDRKQCEPWNVCLGVEIVHIN